jgi:3-oxoacyl-[acyl-carrier-protein] synthase-3
VSSHPHEDRQAAARESCSVYLHGLGVHIPPMSLTNEQIETGMPWLQTNAQWIAEHTGIRERRIADPEQHATDLGYLAAKESLELGGFEPEDIDLILLATNTAHWVYPAGAGRIQTLFGKDEEGRMRMRRAGGLDVQQGCASFIGAVGMASAMVRGGGFENILVVGADVVTRMVDWTDRDAILLGDAATACVVSSREPSAEQGTPSFEIMGHFMRTDGRRADVIQQRGVLNVQNHPLTFLDKDAPQEEAPELYGEGFFGSNKPGERRFFEMDGRQVYRFVTGTVPREGYLEVLRHAGLLEDAPPELELDDVESLGDIKDRHRRREIAQYLATKVDLFVPHSANLSLNQELANEMGIPFERMYVTLHKYGNTSAASVGISLYEALRQESEYDTLTKRDGKGEVKVPSRRVVVPPIHAGSRALLLSFGAGKSWNYLLVERR